MRWCLEWLNTFSVSIKRCPRTNQANRHVWEDYSKGVCVAVAKAGFPRHELMLITVHLKLSGGLESIPFCVIQCDCCMFTHLQ